MELIGYFGAIFIGLLLGLIGGGGSILTVPILVYFFAIDAVLATAYSLFVVGVTAVVGTLGKMKAGQVDYKTALVFAVPSFMAVFLTRYYLVPVLPDPLIDATAFKVSKHMAIMLLFALVMLFSSFSMIRSATRNIVPKEEKQGVRFNYPLIALDGFVVGGVTGLVGAGGGFLIVPALVLMVGLPMKKAVGTSLFIIALKSLIGFTGDLAAHQAVDWFFLLCFCGVAAVGMVIGLYFSRFVSGGRLKQLFGYFVLVMALVILWQEVLGG
jgi:hypothetical protein